MRLAHARVHGIAVWQEYANSCDRGVEVRSYSRELYGKGAVWTCWHAGFQLSGQTQGQGGTSYFLHTVGTAVQYVLYSLTCDRCARRPVTGGPRRK